MGNVNWFYDKDEKVTVRGHIHWVTMAREIRLEIDIDMVNKTVKFSGTLDCGRVESTIRFAENLPVDCKTDNQIIAWIESNVDQLVQNALVKLLTTAVGFFG